jgi:hypothetical protein
VAAFAGLPLAVRMGVVAEAVTPEGVWVLSRPTSDADRFAVGCRIGPEEGSTPGDWICTSEYGELLLLDGARTAVLRAYPLAGVPPEHLVVTPEAVYCGRTGDGMLLPDSMVCRVDRATLQATVRVFPSQPESVVVQPCFTPPSSWAIDVRYLEVTALDAGGGALRVRGADGAWTPLDPVTLAVQ